MFRLHVPFYRDNFDRRKFLWVLLAFSCVLLCVRGVWHLSWGSGHQHGWCLMDLHSCSPQCNLHLTVWEFSLDRDICPSACTQVQQALLMESNHFYQVQQALKCWLRAQTRVQFVILSSSDANGSINGDKIHVNKQQWKLILMHRDMYSHRLWLTMYEWGKAFRNCNTNLKDITPFFKILLLPWL